VSERPADFQRGALSRTHVRRRVVFRDQFRPLLDAEAVLLVNDYKA
jgi:hypothetical protein